MRKYCFKLHQIKEISGASKYFILLLRKLAKFNMLKLFNSNKIIILYINNEYIKSIKEIIESIQRCKKFDDKNNINSIIKPMSELYDVCVILHKYYKIYYHNIDKFQKYYFIIHNSNDEEFYMISKKTLDGIFNENNDAEFIIAVKNHKIFIDVKNSIDDNENKCFNNYNEIRCNKIYNHKYEDTTYTDEDNSKVNYSELYNYDSINKDDDNIENIKKFNELNNFDINKLNEDIKECLEKDNIIEENKNEIQKLENKITDTEQ